MSFSVCKLAATRRNRERKRNNPVGLIYLIFIICAVFCDEPATAAVNCDTEAPFGTDDSFVAGPFNDFLSGNTDPVIFKLSSNSNYVTKDASGGSNNQCNSGHGFDWCRICKTCYDYYTANKCGPNDAYHVERVACSGSRYEIIRNDTRLCKDMPFGPFVQKLNSTVDLHTTNQVNSPRTVTWDYNNITFTFSTASLNQGVVCTFNKMATSVGTGCLSIKAYSVPNSYNLAANGIYWSALHCTAGSVTWTPDDTTAGNAAAGFYVKFTEKTGNAANQIKPNPKIMCTQCQTGWKLTTRTYGHDLCDACDASKNFVEYLPGKCFCKKGYAYDSSQDKCVDTGADSRNFVSPNNDGTYYCKSGYEVSYYTSPESATDFEYYHCEPCKTDDNFVNGTNGCECATGYDRDDRGTPENPEDDTCKISTTQVYVDSTGWFTIPETSSCERDWWQE